MSLEEREMSEMSLEGGGEVATTSLEEEEVATTLLEGREVAATSPDDGVLTSPDFEKLHCDVAGVLLEHPLVLRYRRTGNSCMHRCLPVGKLHNMHIHYCRWSHNLLSLCK